MMQKQRASRRSKDRQQAAVFAYCGLCGGEIYLGQLYYEMDDRLLCPECLPEYAKSYFLSRQRAAAARPAFRAAAAEKDGGRPAGAFLAGPAHGRAVADAAADERAGRAHRALL